MDTRPNYEKPTLEMLFIVSLGVFIVLMLGYQGINLVSPSGTFPLLIIIAKVFQIIQKVFSS